MKYLTKALPITPVNLCLSKEVNKAFKAVGYDLVLKPKQSHGVMSWGGLHTVQFKGLDDRTVTLVFKKDSKGHIRLLEVQ